jgi:hypothetical protein
LAIHWNSSNTIGRGFSSSASKKQGRPALKGLLKQHALADPAPVVHHDYPGVRRAREAIQAR